MTHLPNNEQVQSCACTALDRLAANPNVAIRKKIIDVGGFVALAQSRTKHQNDVRGRIPADHALIELVQQKFLHGVECKTKIPEASGEYDLRLHLSSRGSCLRREKKPIEDSHASKFCGSLRSSAVGSQQLRVRGYVVVGVLERLVWHVGARYYTGRKSQQFKSILLIHLVWAEVVAPASEPKPTVMMRVKSNQSDQHRHGDGLPSYQKIVVHHPTNEQDLTDHGAGNSTLRRRVLHVLGGTVILSLLLATLSYQSPNAVSMSNAKEDFVVPISSASKSWVSKEMDLEMGKSKDKSKKDKSKKKDDKESKKKEKKESKKDVKEEKEEAKKEAKEEKKEAKKEAKKKKEEAKEEKKEKEEKAKEEEKAEKEKEKEKEEKEKEEAKAEKEKAKKEKKAEKESDPDEVAKKEYWKEYGKEWKEKSKEWKTKWAKHTPTPTPVTASTPVPSFTNAPTSSEEPTAE